MHLHSLRNDKRGSMYRGLISLSVLPLFILIMSLFSCSENKKTPEQIRSSRQAELNACIGPRLRTAEARENALNGGYYNAAYDCIDKAAYEFLVVERQKAVQTASVAQQNIRLQNEKIAVLEKERTSTGKQPVSPREESIFSLRLSGPGESLNMKDFQGQGGPEASGDYLKQRSWYSIAIENSELMIRRVTKARASDWGAIKGEAAFSVEPKTETAFKADGLALDLPADAVLAFQMNDGQYDLEPGVYSSAIESGLVLKDKWKTSVRLGKEEWTISAGYERRRDGKVIDGSMSLHATSASGAAIVLVNAGGEVYERQEILWFGDLNDDEKPDLLLKETKINGVVNYVMVVGATRASFSDDPDHPFRAFSSGVDEASNIILKHKDQKWPFPGEERFGQGAFNISEETWNERVGKGKEEGVATLIADRMLEINGESIRFTFQYLPGPSYTDGARTWGPIVLIRTHFRGKSQVLLQESLLDGGPLRVQVDTLDGEPAIQINSFPHYNNSYTRYWIWNSSPKGRFKRLSVFQSQGC